MVPRKLHLACAAALVLCSLRVWGDATGDNAKSYVQLGIANGQKGDYNAAIAAFDTAVEIDPKLAPAYYFRGFARAAQKDFDGAVIDYSKAIEIDPNFADAYNQRGLIKGQKADFDAAISDFQQVIKINPKKAEAHYNLGHYYYFKGDLDDALAEINNAINLQSDVSAPYFIRGLIRHAQGQSDEAAKDFQKSAGLNNAYASFWYWMLETDRGQHGMAEQELSSALQRPAAFASGDWPSQIGNFLLGKETFDQLEAATSQGDPSQLKDRQCEAWFYGGVARHLQGDDKGANELFQHAVETEAKGSEEYIEAKRWLGK